MRALVDAIEARLVDGGMAAYFVAVPDRPTYPYALVWGTPGNDRPEDFAGPRTLDELLGVTWVALTPKACVEAAARGRALLDGWRPVATGWQVQELIREPGLSQAIQPDRDVILPSTNTSPFYGVDRYRLRAHRALETP